MQPLLLVDPEGDWAPKRTLAPIVRRVLAQLFRAVWTRGKLRITKSTYTSQSANHAAATVRSLIVKRIRLGARNSRTHPSSQKRSPRREYRVRMASSIRPPSEAP